MSTLSFIETIHPFIIRHGWREGHRKYYRMQPAEKGSRRPDVDMSLFSSKQCVWKLLLPGDFDTDVFVADMSLGAVPLDLSKSYKRIITCPWYDRSADAIRMRVSEAGVSNIHVLDRIDAGEMRRLGCSIGISLVVITQDMFSTLGEAAVRKHVSGVLDTVGEFSSKNWTNIFIFPRLFRADPPLKVSRLIRQTGINASALQEMGAPHGLMNGSRYLCRHSPENIVEIEMKDFSASCLSIIRSTRGLKTWYGSLQKTAKKLPFSYPSQVLVLSKGEKPSSWMDGFLSHLEKVTGYRLSVQRYISGKPDTILMELQNSCDTSFICRMPLGRGMVNHERVRNNYSALANLRSCGSLSTIAPKPVDHGSYQGQEYFIETFIHGNKLQLNRINSSEVYRMVRPVLLSFSLDAGKDTFINEHRYQTLVGDSLALLKENAWDKTDIKKLQDLEHALQDILLNTRVRLPLVHGDFKIENLLFNSDGLEGIIDWDLSSFPGFPCLDLLYLYGYSFHHQIRAHDRGMTDFIHQLLSGSSREPILQSWYEDYSGCLSLAGEWDTLSGILFWLHYVTKTIRTALPSYDGRTYQKNIRIPLDIITERMKKL